MKFLNVFFLLLGSSEVSSFLSPSSRPHVIQPPFSFRDSLLRTEFEGSKIALEASAISGGNIITDDTEDAILLSSITVGAITAAMGFIYGKILALSLTTVWSTIPSLILKNTGQLNPAYFITGVCTLGGLILGLLSTKLHATFTVADFVSSFSSASIETLPSSSANLLPLLLLSLLTSTFGFSVGPEAPMVCAGALIGSSLSRRWYGPSKRNQEVLSYAGAAGALTAFMGIPIAGSIFALELTCSNAGVSKSSGYALSPTMISSIAALILIRFFLVPLNPVGGHFSYGAVGTLSGRQMIMTAIASGVGGAFLGTLFHNLVAAMKKIAWTSKKTTDKPWKRQIAVKTLIGLIVGIISTNYPQTLFWGEGSLQTVIDGHQTAFSATKHGLIDALTSAARVNPSTPFSNAASAAQVGTAKLISIALACAGKFPGGIIFPLFFAAAPFAHACSSFVAGNLMPVAVICLMAATQASVTRTPLATALILSLSASSTTELSVMLPACVVASYLGVFVSRLISKKSYFSYRE